MSKSSPLLELPGLYVTVDRLVYENIASQTLQQPHAFIYFITIHNDSKILVTIKGRKWIVTHSDGQVLIAEGDGVVGETPQIAPGASFSYNSHHRIHTATAMVDGAYLGLDELGRRVVTRIPRFELRVPDSAME